MTIKYDVELKNARLSLVRDALDGGSLEIFSDSGNRLVSVGFENRSGTVSYGSLLFNGFPKSSMAEGKGRAATGLLKDKGGITRAHGLTVGTSDMHDIVLEHIDVKAENVVRIKSAEIRHG